MLSSKYKLGNNTKQYQMTCILYLLNPSCLFYLLLEHPFPVCQMANKRNQALNFNTNYSAIIISTALYVLCLRAEFHKYSHKTLKMNCTLSDQFSLTTFSDQKP